MKYLIVIFLFLLTTGTSKAQPYQSMFGDSSTEWTKFLSGPLDISPYHTIRFFVEKDTMVGTHIYKKISSSLGPDKYNDFLLREVLDSGKVYCLELHTVNEHPTAPCTREEFLYLDYN